MALKEITTVNDSQLEHVIIEQEMEKNSFATAYFNLASDHKSVVFRVSSPANSFTETFKQKINFNSDLHMKKTTKNNKENYQFEEQDRRKVRNQNIFRENAIMSHLKILKFINPADRNLCFSNSIVSALLNIPIINKLLSEKTNQMNLYYRTNKIIEELVLLNCLSNQSETSTHKLRSIVAVICEESGQIGRSFSDNLQHDAGEFLISMFEHLFKDSVTSNNIDEKIFGGLYQEKLLCKCGNVKELPVQKLSEILTIQLQGQSIESCLMDFLSDEEVNQTCTKCKNQKAVKSIEILTDPSTLIVQLKRHKYDADKRKVIKRQDKINSSIVNHTGDTPTEGHYNVHIYDQITDSYVLLDDLNVSYTVELSSDSSRLCYIVSYTKDD